MSSKDIMKKKEPVIGNSPIIKNVKSKIVIIRNREVIIDADVAELYDVATRRINEAVHNNIEKFPDDYVFQLTEQETEFLRSKISTTNFSTKSRTLPNAFTEKGLYMLATILKSKMAVDTTFAIIETFTAVRNLKRELVSLHQEKDLEKQQEKMKHFGEVLTNIVMPDLETTETESTLELNFIIGKIKHTVKRTKRRKDE